MFGLCYPIKKQTHLGVREMDNLGNVSQGSEGMSVAKPPPSLTDRKPGSGVYYLGPKELQGDPGPGIYSAQPHPNGRIIATFSTSINRPRYIQMENYPVASGDGRNRQPSEGLGNGPLLRASETIKVRGLGAGHLLATAKNLKVWIPWHRREGGGRRECTAWSGTPSSLQAETLVFSLAGDEKARKRKHRPSNQAVASRDENLLLMESSLKATQGLLGSEEQKQLSRNRTGGIGQT
ncbi:uncharacterized protein LOC119945445 [Tachyglossus aculeatus]|uniref:uncharacterized protein LOC119945445 n=1 Tax=Tachyglossus aculeatus TaxID=9261 RepID=UPI0018F3EE06|nr:uncharacterized protein LOC119945445 [Tachyglossus aculeatus]